MSKPKTYAVSTCTTCEGSGRVPAWTPEILRELRKDAKIPLTVMAANVGVSSSYLTDMERGARTMSPKVRRAYLETLGYRAPKRPGAQRSETAPAGRS